MSMDIAVLVVNSLAALAAIIGLIITSHQFKKTMEAQNRATNVSLFDIRMEILTSVESGKFSFNRTRAQMLFNANISERIKEYDDAMNEYRRYSGLKSEFTELIQSMRADDTYEEASDFLAMLQEYDSADPEDRNYQQLQDSIRQRSYTGKWINGVSPLEPETINYVDVEKQETLFYSKAESLRKDIIAVMKRFIETSIQ